MLSKKLAIAAAALAVSGAALAHPPHWAPAHGWHAKQYKHYKHQYYAPRPVVVVPPPHVYYVPRPVYYPAPAYYPAPVYHPAPVYYPAPAPVSPSVSIGIRLPL